MINEIKKYAKEFNIPIMEEEGLSFLLTFIKENNIKSILEIGSAIGYSAIMMTTVNEDVNVFTIERDEPRYKEAVNNIKKMNLEDRIQILYADALDDLNIKGTFDLIFIDAAKSKSIEFFNKYKPYLNDNGYIITDNIKFHGLVEDSSNVKNRRTLQLLKKIKKYVSFLNENEEFKTTFIEVGDTIALSRKK